MFTSRELGSCKKFDKISKWYIVYDNRHFEFSKMYPDDPQIVELECHEEGLVENQCKNLALDVIRDGFVYFLDDDNVVHSNFWNFKFGGGEALVYTFDQQLSPPDKMIPEIRTGNLPFVDQIDTDLIKDRRFLINFYNADGRFIEDIIKTYPTKWRYIDTLGCYYNFIG